MRPPPQLGPHPFPTAWGLLPGTQRNILAGELYLPERAPRIGCSKNFDVALRLSFAPESALARDMGPQYLQTVH